jgi:hypothetical protein
MSEFIFMLTRDDVTVPDARAVVEQLPGTGVRYVGFKDVGLPEPELRELVTAIRANDQIPVLEVVDVGGDGELRSAEAAVRIGVDLLVGGTRVAEIQQVLHGSRIDFHPYVGQVVGHPARLRGSVEEIAAQAERVGRTGVAGINLLAYRWDEGDGIDLAKAVVAAAGVPVLAAGSIDSLDRVRAVRDAGLWAFTVGTAALDATFVPGADLPTQLTTIHATATHP